MAKSIKVTMTAVKIYPWTDDYDKFSAKEILQNTKDTFEDDPYMLIDDCEIVVEAEILDD